MPTTGRYNRLAIGLHWIIAALIIFQIGYAWWGLAPLKDDSPEQAQALALHFSIGLTILLLSLARLGVRIAAPPPPLPADMPGLEKTMARVTHAHTTEQLVAEGSDLETVCLARAVRWHLEHRILRNGSRTVVFT